MMTLTGLVPLGVVLILTSAAVHNVQSQAHHHGCLNSQFQPNLTEAPEWGSCFSVQLNPMSAPKEVHVTVWWLRANRTDCWGLNMTSVELMGRGSLNIPDYRYPIGHFKVAALEPNPRQEFCEKDPQLHRKYHKDFILNKTEVDVSFRDCDPPKIKEPGDPNLYSETAGFVVFNYRKPKYILEYNNVDQIVACAIWEFAGGHYYFYYKMDFTAQIKLTSLPDGDKFVQVGAKKVQFSLLTTLTGCNRKLTSKNTTNVTHETPPDQNKLRPDVDIKKPTTTPTTTTTTTPTSTKTTTKPSTKTTTLPPDPDPVTNEPPVIIVKPTSPTPPTKSTTPQSTVNSGKDSVFRGCLFTKTCVTNKVITGDNNCLTAKSCGIVVSFGEGSNATPEPDETVFEIYGSAGSWIAMGLSEDRVMGDDLVIECVRERDEVNIYLSWNHMDSNCQLGPLRNLCQDNRRMKGENSANGVIRPILASAFENTIYCRFYMKLKIDRLNPWGGPSKQFNLKRTDYHILLAQGDGVRESGPNGNIATHKYGDAYATLLKNNLAKRLSPYPHQVRYLKFHGMSMVLGCLFFMPVGIFIARYLKNTYVHKQVFGVVLWQFLHGIFMFSAFLCLVAGTIFFILGKQGWTAQKSDFHSTGGNICLSLLAVITFTGFFTKDRQPGRVNVAINVCHGVVGHFIYLLSCALVFGAGKVQHSNVSCSFRWILICWIVCYFVMHVVMSYNNYWVDYIAGAPTREHGLSPMSVLIQNIPSSSHHDGNFDEASGETPANAGQEIRDGSSHLKAPGTLLRLYAVGIFTTISFLYVLVLLWKLNLAKSCYTLEDYIKLYKTRSS